MQIPNVGIHICEKWDPNVRVKCAHMLTMHLLGLEINMATRH